MNAIGTHGRGNVSAIVDQETSGAALRERSSPQRQLIDHPGSQILFANLDEADAGSHRGFDEFKEARELSTEWRCRYRRLAARDQIRDRRLQVERHRSRHCVLESCWCWRARLLLAARR